MRFFLLILFFTATSCDLTFPNKQILEKLDGVEKAEYSFNDSGQLEHVNTYFNDGKEDESIEFEYKNGRIDRVSIQNTDNVFASDRTEFYLNALNCNSTLNEFGIKFCNPLVVPDDVVDLYNLLAAVQKFEQAKQKGQTFFLAKDIDVNVKFVSPAISRFISVGSKIHYFEYGLNANGFLSHQIIQFDKSAMQITYQYKKDQLVHIGYSVIYSNGDTAATNRSLEYIDWDLLNTKK